MKLIDTACSVASMIFINCRRAEGVNSYETLRSYIETEMAR